MAAKSVLAQLTFLLLSNLLHAQNLQTYIVQLHPHQLPSNGTSPQLALQWHLSFLQRTLHLDEGLSSQLLYSYRSSIHGFAVRLSEDEFKLLSASDGVIAVRPDIRINVHTTYSYKFLGLGMGRSNAWVPSNFGQGAIIGVLDTGIWPESPSFGDHRMPPVPTKWQGICQEGQDFNASLCNRKLIGARYYYKGHNMSSSSSPPTGEYMSPRDATGHGTHTSSTAAGISVRGASVLGNGAGDARGMAPGAHIAMYKVCWFNGCYSSDIVAGLDDAIEDGVDILSLSLGGFPLPFHEDSIAIGAFQATRRGILVICAAGNNGPIQNSVSNEAPWITTVAASTLDRRFPAIVHTGDGQVLYGESMYPGKHAGKELELVYGGSTGAEFCFNGTLSKAKVRGKMVVCDRGGIGRAIKGEIVKEYGGAAMILANTQTNLHEDSVDAHVLPATLIDYAESVRLKEYIRTARRPVAYLEFGGTVIGKSEAPAVALFSSRGPSLNNPSILKPDIIAPGVNIIAAWPQNLAPTGLAEDNRRVNFNVMSGTSMACPHVSGIASLIRAAHPTWSPAAIRSAIMTSADAVDHKGKPIMDGTEPAGVFAIGAGNVNPTTAVDPGLVYDIKPEDYIAHLCSLGYTDLEIFTITHKMMNCHEIQVRSRHFSLNYPSLSVIFNQKKTKVMIKRRLTNVGLPNSTYSVEVVEPTGVEVKVRPESLTFIQLHQTKGYRVWFITSKREAREEMNYAQGHLTWVHNEQVHYKVRSPISATWMG